MDETLAQYTPSVQPGGWLGGSPASFPPFSFSAWWWLTLTAINQFEDKNTSLTEKQLMGQAVTVAEIHIQDEKLSAANLSVHQ